MVVSILGCGWYGKALAVDLLKKGVTVKGSATSAEKLEQLAGKGVLPYLVRFEGNEQTFAPDFFKCDVLVVSVPPKTKAGEGESFTAKIQQIIKTCVELQIQKIIYISSTGVYGDCNCVVDELSDPNPDTPSGRLLLEAENLFKNETSFKTTIVRFGGLIGPGRHPGRFFAGKVNIPNGLAPVNLIHQLDCVAITSAIIERDAFGHLFNACSPDHPQKAGFYGNMASKANLAMPEFTNELKNWKIVNSVYLTELLKYQFIFRQLNDYPFDLNVDS